MKDSSGAHQDNENSTCEEREVRSEWRRLLWELLLDFAHNSTLHGVRYLTARGLSAVERIFWGIIFLGSVCLCVMGTSKVWVKWQTSPIIISINQQVTSVTEVPFPAVTICPMTKVNQEYYNFTKHYITLRKFLNELHNDKGSLQEKKDRAKVFVNQTPHIRELLNIYNLVCFMSNSRISKYVSDHLDHRSVSHMMKSPHKLLIFECLYTSTRLVTGEPIFQLQQRHISQAGGKYVLLLIRSNSGLIKLTFLEEVNRDICHGMFSGYKVYLHHAADLPQSSSNYYAVHSNEYAILTVKVNLVSTSDSLINYSPHIRQCYFPSERQLYFFKVYTQSNCQLECFTNFSLTQCGCVEFYMPRNNRTLMCVSKTEATCLYEASVRYSTADDEFGNKYESMCKCLPLCHNVQYEADIVHMRTERSEAVSKTWLQVENEINNKSKSNAMSKYMFAWIDMYYKDAQFTSLRRSELFGATDFLANCGGLLGLFLGFSFISLVELFFFATLRLACLFTRHGRTEKKGKADCNTSKLSKF